MAYRMRQRRRQDAQEATAISCSKPTDCKRNLRRRRPSLRYNEDDSQSETIDLSPLRCHFKEECYELDNEVSHQFSKMSHQQQSSTQHQISKSHKMSSTAVRAPTVPSQVKRSHGSLDSSGRSSVVSCESEDSGVSSKSDDDLIGLIPDTPDRHSKPITIPVHSPDSAGVIELIEGKEGFIGYFKPDTSPRALVIPSPTRVSLPSENLSNDYMNCMKVRPRVTRSVSTNVSEDSCDSVLHSNRHSSRRASADIDPNLEDESNSSSSHKAQKTYKRSDKLKLKQCATDSTSSDSTSSERKTLKKLKRKREPNPSNMSNLKHEPSNKKFKTNTVGKSPLRRIQHHNRSPERSPENGAHLPAAASRHCRTRSHVKSLLKDIAVSPITNNSPSCILTKSKRESRRASGSSTKLSSPRLRTVPTATMRSPIMSIQGRRSITSTPAAQEQSEDSGIGSDDQTSSTSSSACKWRFCKSVVSPSDLVEHIERLHVASQRRNSRVYRCNWEGCKVYGQAAKSIVWLEGHVKKHLGPKPYYCIFPECTSRFASQDLLQKHVDNHFTEAEQPHKVVKKVDVNIAKKTDKKPANRRLRGTEKCLPKRADFFTKNIIEAVHWENKSLLEKWSHILSEEGDALMLHGQIMSVATHEVGNIRQEKVQMHWYPEELFIADSWHNINEKEVTTRTKAVKLSSIPRHMIIELCKQ